jgi:hypothetical protein
MYFSLMIFDIATFRIKIRRFKSNSFNFPESFYRDFNEYRVANAGNARIDFTITVVPHERISLSSRKLVRRQGHAYHEENGVCFIKSRSATACVNTFTQKMTLGFRSTNNDRKNNTILMGFVRLSVSLCAVLKGGLPFHSSALAFGNRGIAFSGPSGAGKTTIAKQLGSPWQLLNDDFNIILPQRKKGYGIHSTPFTQRETLKRCVKRSVELRSIFFIEKHETNTIQSLSFKERYILLLGQTYIFPMTDYVGRKILDNAEKICTQVECGRLLFNNNGSVRPFMRDYAGGLK